MGPVWYSVFLPPSVTCLPLLSIVNCCSDPHPVGPAAGSLGRRLPPPRPVRVVRALAPTGLAIARAGLRLDPALPETAGGRSGKAVAPRGRTSPRYIPVSPGNRKL